MDFTLEITVTVDNDTINVIDTGTAYADPELELGQYFDTFYKLFIMDKDDTEIYRFSSDSDGDEYMEETPASEGGLSIRLVEREYVTSADGVYKVHFVAIPSYSEGFTYEENDVVYYGESVYLCIQGGTGQDPETATEYWTAIDADTWDEIEANVSSNFYASDELVVVKGKMLSLLSDLVYRANVSNPKTLSDWRTLFDDPEWVEAAKLYLDNKALVQLETDEELEAIVTIFERVNNVISKYNV